MDATIAAEGKQGEIARIAAAIGRDRLDGPHHGDVGETVNPECCIPHAATERGGDPVREGLSGRLRLDRHRAAGQGIRVQIAESDIGIGHGRLGAAGVVADRAWRGTGTLRADLERTCRIDRDEAAAAGADFRDVDDRQLQGVATALHQPARQRNATADLVFVRA